MRSSKTAGSALALLTITAAALAAGCSSEPGSRQADGAAATVDCVTTAVEASDVAMVQEARRAVEGGPAYEALASRSALRSCRATSRAGETSLEYGFANGGTLTFTRNAAIEYSNLEVGFGSAPVATGNIGPDAIELLRRVERASFSPDGCGITWNEPMPLAATDGISETGYYGNTCNCQARVRADASGRVLGFVFRSSC